MARRARRSQIDEEGEDSGPSPFIVAAPNRWESPEWRDRVQGILDALEISAIDEASRLYLQRRLCRAKMFNADDQGHVVMTLRCIVESEGNDGALVDPIVSAVSSAISPYVDRGIALIEAFDQIPLLGVFEQMRALEYFYEREAPSALERILKHKLRRLLTPPEPVKPPTAKAQLEEAKAHAAASRLAEIERNLEMGRQMVALRDKTPCNKTFGRLRSRQFDIETTDAAETMRIARRYGDRPDIYRKAANWSVMVALSSTTMPESRRKAFERRILTGETVRANEIAGPAAKPRAPGQPRTISNLMTAPSIS
jgi:hypothetical protein